MAWFDCPSCRRQIIVHDDMATRPIFCPDCGHEAASRSPVGSLEPVWAGQFSPMEQIAPRAFAPCPGATLLADLSSQPGNPPLLRPTPPTLPLGYFGPTRVSFSPAISRIAGWSLALGLVALASSWVPFVGTFFAPLALVGTILGIIGLTQRSGSKGLAAGGLFASIAALVIMVFVGSIMLKSLARPRLIAPINVFNPPRPQQPWGGAMFPGAPSHSTAGPTIQSGDFKVVIKSARIARVPLKTMGKTALSADHYLIIELDISNQGQNYVRVYRSWRDRPSGAQAACLRDSLGITYLPVQFDSPTRPIADASVISVFPGQTISDVLIFDAPSSTISSLTLMLPGVNCGMPADFILHVPISMIQR